MASWLLAGVGGLALAGFMWGWIEARLFVVRRVSVPVLPPGASPIRLLHVSDFHLVPRQHRKVRWIRRLAHLAPDLIVDTGDNIADARGVPVLIEALGPLLTLPGVFVNGSNDYLSPRPQNPFTYFRGPTKDGGRRATLPTDAMVSAFERAGWHNAGNARVHLNVKGVEISFVGVDDPHIGRDRMPSASKTRGVIHIGVAHAPYRRVLAAFQEDGAQLVLAGHTHGGQVRVPGVGALVTNCDLDRQRARGLSGWPGAHPDEPGGKGSLWLHVSAGVGTSPYVALRFACRPEVTILDLTVRDEGSTG